MNTTANIIFNGGRLSPKFRNKANIFALSASTQHYTRGAS